MHAPRKGHSNVSCSILQWRRLTGSFNSILYGYKNSELDIGTKAVLTGKGSKVEMISRAISREGSKMIIRGMIEGDSNDCKGHLNAAAY